MIDQIRKAELEWRLDDAHAEGFLMMLRRARIDAAAGLPDDLRLIDSGIRDTPPSGSPYRYVWAIYEALNR